MSLDAAGRLYERKEAREDVMARAVTTERAPAIEAMLKMSNIDIATLERAYAQKD
jgi:hypothetical protein